MKQTPMQEAIDIVKGYKERHFINSTKNSEKQIVVDTILQVILNDLNELIPKEQKLIEDEKLKTYYKNTFKQK